MYAHILRNMYLYILCILACYNYTAHILRNKHVYCKKAEIVFLEM